MKRTDLKRKTGLKRKMPLRSTQKSSINQRSPERAAEERIYSKRIKIFKAKHPHCQACARTNEYRALHEFGVRDVIRLTADVHHMAGREHGMLLREEFWLAVCRSCHNWIGEHGALSYTLGLRIRIPTNMGLRDKSALV
jgi:hypothetical protein